jgi:putative transposase
MARLPRLFVPEVPAHIILRGNNRQAIFRGDGDRIYFHRCLAELSRLERLEIHAYVLMTNHVHLLATAATREASSRVMQRLGRRYVGYFNHVHDRTGTLWEGRFRSTLVEAQRYLFVCQRYIELNPVRAGMVRDPGDFPWSSHRFYSMGRADDLVTPHPIVQGMGSDAGSRRTAYIAEFGTPLDGATIDRIRDSVNKGWALGDDAFCQSLMLRGSRRSTPLSPGRPSRGPGGNHDARTSLIGV